MDDSRRQEAKKDMVENPYEGEDTQWRLEGLEQYAMEANRVSSWDTL
jgi:hypothetical protein